MLSSLKRIAVLCLYVCASIYLADAQPKAAGTSYSFSSLGLTYEHTLNQECFISADIKIETGAFFIDRKHRPGASVSVTGNFIIDTWTSRNGNTISAFAGPGVAAGMSYDFRKGDGYFFGLKGRLGIECLFDRKVSLSICLAPVLGMHMMQVEEHLEMKYYRNGLINAIIPEIGIKYLF